MLQSYLKENKIFIERKIEEYLLDLKYPKEIAEGMRYSVLNGGKRLRPILLFMTLEILGKEKKVGIPSAIAIELIHSYSLVHDDLPALDNDDYRRGKLTTHKKFGEAAGILIGDALLTYAFKILTSKNKNSISSDKIVEIIEKISDYSGINGMIGGQMIDIKSEGKKINLDTLKYIHKNKTGKLLKLPVEIACIIADASFENTKCLEEYAKLLGLAFQIKDDILDIEGDFKLLGKPVGSDIKKEKSTYPSIIGLNKSKELLVTIIEEAKNKILENFDKKSGENFIKLADYIADRNK